MGQVLQHFMTLNWNTNAYKTVLYSSTIYAWSHSIQWLDK